MNKFLFILIIFILFNSSYLFARNNSPRPLPSVSIAVMGSGSYLGPGRLFVESSGILSFEAWNMSDFMATQSGRVVIFINEQQVYSKSYSELKQQELQFGQPNSKVKIVTDIKASGIKRVAVKFDETNHDKNKYQKTRTARLEFPTISGLDVKVAGVQVGQNGAISLIIRTHGGSLDAALISKLRLRVFYKNNEISSESRFAFKVPQTILPVMVLPIVDTNKRPLIGQSLQSYRFVLEATQDIDTTNNILELLLPARQGTNLFAGYFSTQTPAALKTTVDSIIFNNRKLSQWTVAEKTKLASSIKALESGDYENAAPKLPPSPTGSVDDRALHMLNSAETAFDFFVSYISLALYVDVYKVVPWRLSKLKQEHRDLLLNSKNRMTEWTQGPGQPTKFSVTNSVIVGDIFNWNPTIPFNLGQRLQIIKNTKIDTLAAVTDWLRGVSTHADIDVGTREGKISTYEKNWQYVGPPPIDRVIYPLFISDELERRLEVAGCHGQAGLYHSLLAAVNIPVVSHGPRFSQTPRNSYHSSVFFPNIGPSGLALVHSDDVNHSVGRYDPFFSDTPKTLDIFVSGLRYKTDINSDPLQAIQYHKQWEKLDYKVSYENSADLHVLNYAEKNLSVAQYADYLKQIMTRGERMFTDEETSIYAGHLDKKTKQLMSQQGVTMPELSAKMVFAKGRWNLYRDAIFKP